MSFSNLLELEACPKRWALSGAQYPEIWPASGYPRLPNLAALRGAIVHNVIRSIAERFVLLGREGNSKIRVSQALRNLGGFTRLIGNTIEAVLQQYYCNPRALPSLKRVHAQLHSEIPDLRVKSQELLARVNFDLYDNLGSSEDVLRSGRVTLPLSNGIYSELELKSTDLGWHGFVDLLTLSSDFCEIRDFKAGKEKEEHISQLHTYALLWLKDCELNPSGMPVTRLVISYLKNDIEISTPSRSDYLKLEDSLKKRTERVLMSIESMPPGANVGPDNCQFCQVRHLCDEYWDAQQKSAPKLLIDAESPFLDIQAIIVSRRGPSSWDAKVDSCYFALTEIPFLILDPAISLSMLNEGDKVRFLNVIATIEDDAADSATQPLRVSCGSRSECFILSRI